MLKPLLTKNTLSTLLLVVAVVVTWYLKPDPPVSMENIVKQADYFIVDFNRKKMDSAGGVVAEFSADRVDHYHDDGRAELIQPHVITYSPDNPPWHLHADHGTQWEDGNLVNLQGGVIAIQNHSDSSRFSRMETEGAELMLDQEYMKTDQLITFTTERSTTTSIGAQIWLDSGEIRLLKDSTVQYN